MHYQKGEVSKTIYTRDNFCISPELVTWTMVSPSKLAMWSYINWTYFWSLVCGPSFRGDIELPWCDINRPSLEVYEKKFCLTHMVCYLINLVWHSKGETRLKCIKESSSEFARMLQFNLRTIGTQLAQSAPHIS